MHTAARTAPRIRVQHGMVSPTRTPVSNYLDEYIGAEIECMVREIGGWRRGRGMHDQNRRAIVWIEKNAARFRERWNREHGLVEAERAAA